jgi:hypothetical protein
LARLNLASQDQIKRFPRPESGQLFAAVAYYYAELVADIVPFNTGAAEKDYQQLEQYAQKYRNNAQGEANPECDPAKKVPSDVGLCVIRIMSRLGRARISAANFQDPQNILNLTDDAARTQRALPYDEPPAWLYPVDQTLAGLMLSRYVSKRPQPRSYLELAMSRLEASLQGNQLAGKPACRETSLQGNQLAGKPATPFGGISWQRVGLFRAMANSGEARSHGQSSKI